MDVDRTALKCTALPSSLPFHFCTPGLLHVIAIMELGAECLLWEPSVFLLQPPVRNTKKVTDTVHKTNNNSTGWRDVTKMLLKESYRGRKTETVGTEWPHSFWGRNDCRNKKISLVKHRWDEGSTALGCLSSERLIQSGETRSRWRRGSFGFSINYIFISSPSPQSQRLRSRARRTPRPHDGRENTIATTEPPFRGLLEGNMPGQEAASLWSLIHTAERKSPFGNKELDFHSYWTIWRFPEKTILPKMLCERLVLTWRTSCR